MRKKESRSRVPTDAEARAAFAKLGEELARIDREGDEGHLVQFPKYVDLDEAPDAVLVTTMQRGRGRRR